MKYYQIKQGGEVRYAPKFIWLEKKPFSYNISKEEFDTLEDTYVAYYDYEHNIELPDILEQPSFMVSEVVRHVLQMYMPSDEDICFKGIQLYPTIREKKISAYYWLPSIPEYICLSGDSELLPDGTVKKLVLDSRNIPDIDVFKVANILENRIIVSMAVVESIVRRSPYGVEFEEVRIK